MEWIRITYLWMSEGTVIAMLPFKGIPCTRRVLAFMLLAMASFDCKDTGGGVVSDVFFFRIALLIS